MNEEYIPVERGPRSLAREIYDWVEAGLFAVAGMVLIFTFIVRVVGVDGDSMKPTLHDQDRLVISRVLYTPKQGDIVVITKPVFRGEPLIKRVVATGGQTIDIDFDNHIVYVDDQALHEPYIAEPTARSFDMEFPAVVPEGHVFVMGDNRNASWDSRDTEIGMIDNRYILGRVIFRLLPYRDMGIPG